MIGPDGSAKVHFPVYALFLILVTVALVMGSFTIPNIFGNNIAPRRTSFSTLADLEIVQSQLAPVGDLAVAYKDQQIFEISFTVTSSSAAAVALTDGSLRIDYRDSDQRLQDLPWSSRFLGEHDSDAWLEEGEQLEVVVHMDDELTLLSGEDTEFAVEVRPSTGAILSLFGTISSPN